MSKIRQLAKSTRDAPLVVLSSVFEDCDQAVALKLSKVQSMKRTIRYIGQQTLAGPALPLTSSETVFPPELNKTFKGDQFLMYDSGPMEERIDIIATRRNLKFLSKRYADGTFRTVPLLFHQPYTVHGLRGNDLLPLVFGLLPDKAEKTYIKFLREIKNIELSCAPLSIAIDFEKVMMNACLKEFQNIEVNSCFSTLTNVPSE